MQSLAIGGLAVLFSLLPVGRLCGERPLRIVTFNVQCLQAPETKDSRLSRFRWSPARRAHLEAIAGVIETLEPDICALVEVTGPESVNRLVNILHHKGLGQYRGHHVESQDRFSGFDVAFVTRTAADRVGRQSIHHFAPSGDDSPWRQSYAYTDERGTPHQHETTLARHALLYTTVAGHKLAFLGPASQKRSERRAGQWRGEGRRPRLPSGSSKHRFSSGATNRSCWGT